jgi:diacylglycerol O-acyltransferase
VGHSHEFVEIAPARLNATDATLWDIERNPNLRTTIVGVLVLDRPFDPERLVHVLEAASRSVPRLRERVVPSPAGIGPPRWEVDDRFELADHLDVVEVDDPVDRATIAAVAEPMASTPFDRDRPLWECTAIRAGGGPSAVVLKIHHSFTDGVGGITLLDTILDADADAAPADLARLPIPRRAAGPGAGGGPSPFVRAAGAPFRVASAAVTTAYHPRRVTDASWKGMRSAMRMMAPSSAPRSPLMVGRSTRRSVGTTEVDLDRLHAAAAAHGCTVNHAFVAATLAGVREYHRRYDAPVADLRVTMPVSVRRAEHEAAGNQWAPVRFVAPLDAAGPVDRMIALRDLLDARRREPALGFNQQLAGVVQRLPSAISSVIVGGMMHGVDLAVTNVPGLRHRAFLAGAEVDRVFAFAPTGGAALNVALVSHLDTACVGLLADTAAVDDVALLGELVADAFGELVDAALTAS